MSTPEADPGFWKMLFEWAWAGVLLLGGAIYANARGEIGSLRKAQANMITREVFEAHEKREEEDRKERKTAEGALFGKIDDLRKATDDKLNTIIQHLLNSK